MRSERVMLAKTNNKEPDAVLGHDVITEQVQVQEDKHDVTTPAEEKDAEKSNITKPDEVGKSDVSVTFIERFVHFFRLRFQEPMSLFLTVGMTD